MCDLNEVKGMKLNMDEIVIKGNARNEAMSLMDKYTKGNLQVGEYAYELVTETYINLIA